MRKEKKRVEFFFLIIAKLSSPFRARFRRLEGAEPVVLPSDSALGTEHPSPHHPVTSNELALRTRNGWSKVNAFSSDRASR